MMHQRVAAADSLHLTVFWGGYTVTSFRIRIFICGLCQGGFPLYMLCSIKWGLNLNGNSHVFIVFEPWYLLLCCLFVMS